MTGITIRVPEDIVRALRLPPDAVAAEPQREPGPVLYRWGIPGEVAA